MRDVCFLHARIFPFSELRAGDVQLSLRGSKERCSAFSMRTVAGYCLCIGLLTSLGVAASKQHVVTFGKWTTVKLMAGDDESMPVEIKVRPLLVDGRTKLYARPGLRMT